MISLCLINFFIKFVGMEIKFLRDKHSNDAMFPPQAYLKSDPTERSHDLALIITLRQGQEDKSFTSLFSSWDDAMWEVQA